MGGNRYRYSLQVKMKVFRRIVAGLVGGLLVALMVLLPVIYWLVTGETTYLLSGVDWIPTLQMTLWICVAFIAGVLLVVGLYADRPFLVSYHSHMHGMAQIAKGVKKKGITPEQLKAMVASAT